ncbi:MAG: hypothetical protein J6Q85_04640 [Clostridia bacterium]|nr:hypothetical protein [Clostridia bacterium]
MATFKKISVFVLVLVLAVASFALTSCMQTETDPCKDGHTFTTYTSNGDATCIADGTKTAKCDKCDKTDTVADTGSALGHSFVSYASNNDATCEANGTETAKCVRCEVTDTREDQNSSLGHSFTSYIPNNNATCTENGTETAKCDRCDKTNSREIADSALDHSFTTYTSNGDATCIADGTKTAKCDRCDVTDTVADVDSALGHSFTDYKSNNDATCTANGTETAKCDRCDVTDTREVAESALGHSFTSYTSNENATCTANGTETAKCDRCDATDTREVAESALGHSFTSYTSNENATCTANGTETAKCDRCDVTDTREIAESALGHSFTEYKSNGDATCKKDGTKTAKCDRCDVTDTVADEGTKLEHVFVDGECSVCGDIDTSVPTPGLVYTYNEKVDGYYVTGYEGTKTKIVIPATYEDKAVLKIDVNALGDVEKVYVTGSMLLVITEGNWDAVTTLSDGTEKETILSAGTFNLIGTAVLSKSSYVYYVPYVTFDDATEATKTITNGNMTIDVGTGVIIEESTGNYLELDDPGAGVVTTTFKTTDSVTETSNVVFETNFKIVSTSNAARQYNIISFRDADGKQLALSQIHINAVNGQFYFDGTPQEAVKDGAGYSTLGGSVAADSTKLVSKWFNLKLVLKADNTIEITVNGKTGTMTPTVENLTTRCKQIAFTSQGNSGTAFTNCFDDTYFGTEIIDYSAKIDPVWNAATDGAYTEIVDPATNVIESYKVTDTDPTKTTFVQFSTKAGTDETPVFVVKADMLFYQLDEAVYVDCADCEEGQDCDKCENGKKAIYGTDTGVSYNSITVFNDTNQRYRIRFGNGTFSDAKHNSVTAGKGTYKYGEWFTVEAKFYCVTPDEWVVALSINGEIVEVQKGKYNISSSTATGVSKALTVVRFTNDTAYMGNYEVRNVYVGHEALDYNDFAKDGNACIIGHDFQGYVDDNNATCEANGTETAKCVRCDATDTKPIANSKLGHDFQNYVANEATCTENANESAKCTRCDATDVKETPDTALGHSFSGGVCSVCGELDPDSEVDLTIASSGVVFHYNEKVDGYYVTAYTGTAPTIIIPAIYNDKPVLKVDVSALSSVSKIYLGGSMLFVITDGYWDAVTTLSDGSVKETVLSAGTYNLVGTAVISKSAYTFSVPYVTYESLEEGATSATVGATTVAFGNGALVADSDNTYLKLNDTGSGVFTTTFKTTDTVAADSPLVFETKFKIDSEIGAARQYNVIKFNNASGKLIALMQIYINGANGQFYYDATPGAAVANNAASATLGGNIQSSKDSAYCYSKWVDLKIVINSDNTMVITVNGKSQTLAAVANMSTCQQIAFTSQGNSGTKFVNSFDDSYFGKELVDASAKVNPSWIAASGGAYTEIVDPATNVIESYKVTDTDPTKTTFVQFSTKAGTDETPVFVVKADMLFYQFDEAIATTDKGDPIYGADTSVSYNSITVFNDVNQRYGIRFGNGTFSDAKHNSSTVGKGTYKYGEWFTVEAKFYCVTPNEWVVALSINGEIVEVQKGTYNISSSASTGVSKALTVVRFMNATAYMGNYEVKNVSLSHVAYSDADFTMPAAQ